MPVLGPALVLSGYDVLGRRVQGPPCGQEMGSMSKVMNPYVFLVEFGFRGATLRGPLARPLKRRMASVRSLVGLSIQILTYSERTVLHRRNKVWGAAMLFCTEIEIHEIQDRYHAQVDWHARSTLRTALSP